MFYQNLSKYSEYRDKITLKFLGQVVLNIMQSKPKSEQDTI